MRPASDGDPARRDGRGSRCGSARGSRIRTPLRAQPMLTSSQSMEAATRAVRVGVPTGRPDDPCLSGVPALGSSPIGSPRTKAVGAWRPSVRGGRWGTGWRLTSSCHRGRRRRCRRRRRRRCHGRCDWGVSRFAPMRLMSDSVLHFSDSRFPALQEIVWAETGRGWRSSPVRWKMIAGRKHSRFRDPHAIRLIHWTRGFINTPRRSASRSRPPRGTR